MSQAIFVKVIYNRCSLTEEGYPVTSTSITSQIQWQGLWPRHHPVLRSKTARKVSVDTIGCYRQPRSRRYIHGVHAIQPPKLQGEIGRRDRFSSSFRSFNIFFFILENDIRIYDVFARFNLLFCSYLFSFFFLLPRSIREIWHLLSIRLIDRKQVGI